jgi:hypothetical protein
MSQLHNDIVNGNVNRTHNYNSNDNVDKKYEVSRRVERIADQLVQKFGSDTYRGFYCKVAWKLSEARIWNNYEAAIKANPSQPGKLFSYLCKRDGV